MAIIGAVGLFISYDFGIIQPTRVMTSASYRNVAYYTLVTIPLFILMGEYMRVSGLTSDIFYVADRFLSHIRGGLAFTTIIANGIFAVLSGSTVAASAAISRIAVPEMRKYGYDDRLSVGTVSAAGTFASLMPPSIPLIVYGILTETSITALFLAGIIPAILSLVGYAIVIYIWALREPEIMGVKEGELTRYSWSERMETFPLMIPLFALAVIVLGGLYGGFVTVTEAGALGAIGALVIGWYFGELNFSENIIALREAIQTSTMIFIILIGAVFFTFYISLTGFITDLLGIISATPMDAWIVLGIVLVMFIALGTVMVPIGILILTMPIVYPLVTELGFNSVWFGILIVKTIEMGLVTPPFGINVYVACEPVDTPPSVGFKGAMRLLIADFAVLFLLILFPSLALFIPELAGAPDV